MTTQILTAAELKSVKLSASQSVFIKHQNAVRVHLGKVSNIEDQTDYPKTKKRALEIVNECIASNLDYVIVLCTNK